MSVKKNSRSTSYPSIPLEEALKKLSTLKDSLGINGEYGREAIAKGMGYGSLSGSSARAVAALVQYGLLDRNKDQYSISDLGKQYLMPLESGQADDAVKVAVLNPPLLRKIFDEYEGQPLPGQLKNILAITYGIQSAAVDTALRVVKQGFQFAGLVDDDGSLHKDSSSEVVDDINADAENGEDSNRESVTTPAASHSLINVNVPSSANAAEQGINISGDGWQLTVLLKTSRRHTPETRKKVRALLEMADDIADLLYEEDAKE